MKITLIQEHELPARTVDELLAFKGFIGVVNIIGMSSRFFWNYFTKTFSNSKGVMAHPTENLRTALSDKGISEVHIFETAKELYLWLAEGEK